MVKRLTVVRGRRTQQAAFPSDKTLHETQERQFWSSFKNYNIAQTGPVTHVAFAPAPSVFPLLAVTASTSVRLYDMGEEHVAEEAKTINRFHDVAYSAVFRRDGKLLLTGGEDKRLRLFNATTRALLRSLHGHTAAVHCVRFAADEVDSVASASDDNTVRIWDVLTQQCFMVLSGHTDYVRCVDQLPQQPQVWVSGSYDGTVRFWDVRSSKCEAVLRHASPVEALLCHPSSTDPLVVVAGGTNVSTWQGRQLRTESQRLAHHQKTVTALAWTPNATHLLTAGLDHQVKVYSTTATATATADQAEHAGDGVDLAASSATNSSSYTLAHTFMCSAPVLSLAVSPTGEHLALGCVDGTLSVRRREAKKKTPESEASRKGKAKGQGKHYTAAGGGALRTWDHALVQFRYGKALDLAQKSSSPGVLVAMLRELQMRNALRTAVGGRDALWLVHQLRFLVKALPKPHLTPALLPYADMLLDVYTETLGTHPAVDEAIQGLREVVARETEQLAAIARLSGAVELFLHNTTTTTK